MNSPHPLRSTLHSKGLAPWLRTGLFVGIGLSLVFIAWLFIANRVPALEEFALLRNAVGAALMLILMIIPATLYARFPGRLLASGLIGWTLFSLCYRLMEQFFELLETRLGAFHVFMMGVVVYLILAVLGWITLLWLLTRRAGARVHHGKIH
jgi:hypothetical protein